MTLILLGFPYLHNNHLYKLSRQMHLLTKSQRVFIALLCNSDCMARLILIHTFIQLQKSFGPIVSCLHCFACARSNLHLWLRIFELKIFWGFSNILAITCQVLGGTRPTQSDFLSDFLIIKTVYQLGSNKCMI